jgi:hypothetical protein
MKNQSAEQTRLWLWRETVFLAVVFFLACLAGIAALGFALTKPDADDASVAYATWALALFTFVLAVGIPVTILDSSHRFREQQKDQFYAQLDGTYGEIQKLVIAYPHLGSPALLFKNSESKPERLTQYDAFAFIVWNFLESIHDFTRAKDSRSRMLLETWQSIIDYEGPRHLQWFLRSENQRKFKKPFRDYIDKERKRWSATPPPESTT